MATGLAKPWTKNFVADAQPQCLSLPGAGGAQGLETSWRRPLAVFWLKSEQKRDERRERGGWSAPSSPMVSGTRMPGNAIAAQSKSLFSIKLHPGVLEMKPVHHDGLQMLDQDHDLLAAARVPKSRSTCSDSTCPRRAPVLQFQPSSTNLASSGLSGRLGSSRAQMAFGMSGSTRPSRSLLSCPPDCRL